MFLYRFLEQENPYLCFAEGDAEPNAEGGGDATATAEATQAAESAQAAEGEQQADPAKRPWFMERIDGLTRQKSELTTRLQTLEQQNRALTTTVETLLGQGATPQQAAAAAGDQAAAMDAAGNAGDGAKRQGQPQGRLYTEAELQQIAAQKAHELLQQQQQTSAVDQFNNRCNAVAEAWKAKAGEAAFNSALGNLRAAGVLPADNNSVYERAFLETAIEFDEAPDLLHHLGQHPDEAIRIKSLPPARMAAAFAKLAGQLAAPKTRPASNAPAPVTRIDGAASPEAPTFETASDMATFIRLREEQDAKRRGIARH